MVSLVLIRRRARFRTRDARFLPRPAIWLELQPEFALPTPLAVALQSALVAVALRRLVAELAVQPHGALLPRHGDGATRPRGAARPQPSSNEQSRARELAGFPVPQWQWLTVRGVAVLLPARAS